MEVRQKPDSSRMSGCVPSHTMGSSSDRLLGEALRHSG